MAFELVTRNIVVRGEFNLAIIGPRWLVVQEITPDGEIEAFVSDDPSAPRHFKFDGFDWQVGFHRLVVTSTGANAKDPGPTVAAILEKLPHTPVTGAGHNFSFDAPNPLAELCVRLGNRDTATLSGLLGEELRESSFSVVVSTGKATRVAVKVLTGHPGQRVDINFHHDTPDAAAAANAARQSEACRQRADEVLRMLAEGATC